MYEQDYLLRLISQLVQAILHAQNMVKRAEKGGEEQEGTQEENDPLGAATMLEIAFGEAIEMSPDPVLSLAPESMAGVLQVSGVDLQLAPHLVECLLLEADYLRLGGRPGLGDLREKQAEALALVYGLNASEEEEDGEPLSGVDL